MRKNLALALAFVASFGSAGVALAADIAKPTRVYRVGYLEGGVAPPLPDRTAQGCPVQGKGSRNWLALLEGLRERGYAEGQNLIMVCRYYEGRDKRAPNLAADLVTLKVDLLISTSHQGTVALKEATSTIPIVFRVGIDPVVTGLVASFAHPGGNLTTGIFQQTGDLFGKRFELMRELAPQTHRVGVLIQSTQAEYEPMLLDLARRTRFEVVFLVADGPEEIRRVLGSATTQRLEGFVVTSGPRINAYRQVVVDAIAATRLPAVHPEVTFAEVGGVVAYASDIREGVPILAEYADSVLKGAKPGDLPVQQSRTAQLVVNLKAARAQGIPIPQSLLLRADEVIQ
jgi:putative ABC transport system substrate-binding protein